MSSANRNGFCWRETCGVSGKTCPACRAHGLMEGALRQAEAESSRGANVVELRSETPLPPRGPTVWPWGIAIGIGFMIAAWAILSGGCASLPAADAVNDAADALKLAQCVDDVVTARNARLRTAAAVAVSDAGVPAKIDTKDPYPDAGTAVPEWFTDGGH